ncbi:TPA: hypothetical protein KED65_002643 [Staphylococcus aureus]|nr:hypothetical protein [Staphylococcus aureus]
MGKRAQHSEIGSSVSTDIASWGAKHSEIGSSVSTDIASWGPNTEAGGKSAYYNV